MHLRCKNLEQLAIDTFLSLSAYIIFGFRCIVVIALTVEMCDVTFCRYDYLTISNVNNLLFGTFCGYKPGHTVGVSGDSAVITFRSDSYYEERGFLLFFSVQPPGRFVHDYYICNPACLHR